MGLRVLSSLGFGAMIFTLLACAGSSITQPNNPVATFSFPNGKGGQLIDPSFSAIEANQFQISGTKTVEVTALGVELAEANQPARSVGIFDSTGNLIASASVSTTDRLVDGYLYKDIAPVNLTPGNQYYIGALHENGTVDNYYWSTNTASTPAYIQDQGTCYRATSVFQSGTFSTPVTTIRHYIGNFLSRELN